MAKYDSKNSVLQFCRSQIRTLNGKFAGIEKIIDEYFLGKNIRHKRENPDLGLIIIDYLQLMNSDRNSENRVTEMSEISRSVKSLARDLDITVIALSQLNRAVENRNNKRPLMSDLRESGALEQDADLVAFVYRDEYYNETPENKGLAEVNIAKHRNGKTGKVKLHFASNIIKFENLADNDPAMSMPTNYED